MLRLDEQEAIRLGHVVQIKPHRAIVTHFDARRTPLVRAQPEIEMRVLPSVEPLPDR
jgi:hypothetical protein